MQFAKGKVRTLSPLDQKYFGGCRVVKSQFIYACTISSCIFVFLGHSSCQFESDTLKDNQRGLEGLCV
jgi:hypothetical protein